MHPMASRFREGTRIYSTMKRPRNGIHPGSQLRYLVGRITTVSPQASRNASTRFSIPASRFRFSVREIKLAALA
jgi:hypothetical protein